MLKFKQTRVKPLPLMLASMVLFAAGNSLAAEDAKKPAVSAPVAVKASTSNDVLAKGPFGLQVTVADVLSEVNKMPAAMRPDFFSKPENVHQIANNLLVRRILAKEAERDQLDKDLVVKAAMAVAHDRVLSDARLNKMDMQNEPSASALDAYAKNVYQSKPERFEVPAQTRASHILIEKKDESALKQAEELIAKIKAGAKFEDMAKEFSKDPGSAQRGGDLGFFGEGRMVKPFEDAVKALAKPGDLSAPVESQFGYHIIRLDERKPKTIQTYEEVRPQLMEEARAAILSDKRVQKVAAITQQMTFEKQAIIDMTKEGAQALGQK